MTSSAAAGLSGRAGALLCTRPWASSRRGASSFRATSPRLLASSSGTCRTVLPRSAKCRWRAGC
eukprot:5284909-Heterocapsa_arctica.AAC.1